MIFRVQSFNKDLDMYNVISDAGGQMCVTSYQILNVMIQGYVFDNAKLTKKGFAINTDKGTRYIQVDGISREMSIAIQNKLEQDRLAEEAKKQQMTQAIKKPSTNNQRVKINGSVNNKNTNKIVYRGTTYLSDTQLCRKYNRDINKFRELYAKGYSIDEALGIKELRPESEVIEAKKRTSSMLDSMARERGEFNI